MSLRLCAPPPSGAGEKTAAPAGASTAAPPAPPDPVAPQKKSMRQRPRPSRTRATHIRKRIYGHPSHSTGHETGGGAHWHYVFKVSRPHCCAQTFALRARLIERVRAALAQTACAGRGGGARTTLCAWLHCTLTRSRLSGKEITPARRSNSTIHTTDKAYLTDKAWATASSDEGGGVMSRKKNSTNTSPSHSRLARTSTTKGTADNGPLWAVEEAARKKELQPRHFQNKKNSDSPKAGRQGRCGKVR